MLSAKLGHLPRARAQLIEGLFFYEIPIPVVISKLRLTEACAKTQKISMIVNLPVPKLTLIGCEVGSNLQNSRIRHFKSPKMVLSYYILHEGLFASKY